MYPAEKAIINAVGINNSKVHSFWDEADPAPGKYDFFMTLEEIAKQMGVTRERIRQIETKALRKLQHPKRSSLLQPFLTDNFCLKKCLQFNNPAK